MRGKKGRKGERKGDGTERREKKGGGGRRRVSSKETGYNDVLLKGNSRLGGGKIRGRKRKGERLAGAGDEVSNSRGEKCSGNESVLTKLQSYKKGEKKRHGW